MLAEEVVGLGYWEFEDEDEGKPERTIGLTREMLMASSGWGLVTMEQSISALSCRI